MFADTTRVAISTPSRNEYNASALAVPPIVDTTAAEEAAQNRFATLFVEAEAAAHAIAYTNCDIADKAGNFRRLY